MRLALFGGTFDPIHNAHLTVAREAASQFHLDQVWFVPAAHPPHKSDHTWTDFFIHIGTIILGILIALGLEQFVEYLHHRHLASEASRALLNERHIDEEANQFNIFATRRHQRDLQHDLVMLHALRAHQPLQPGPFIIQHVSYIYAGAEWQNVHQSGTINYLTGNLAALTYRYQIQDRFLDLLSRSNEDLARAASVLRSPVDPLNTSYEDNVAFSGFFRRLVADPLSVRGSRRMRG